MDKVELQRRTKRFGLRVLALIEALPRTTAGRTVVGQLARSGTSVGSNYRAACKARSAAEFVSKIGTVEEEADESAFWMEMIEGKMLKPARVQPLLREAEELVAIMGASRLTASRNTRALRNRQSAIGNRQSQDGD